MTRKEANIKIADILMNTEWQWNYNFAGYIKNYAELYPDQRCGQIICNYICPDYRSDVPSSTTVAFLRDVFPDIPDPFFEESETTLNRLKDKLKQYYKFPDIDIKDKLGKLVYYDMDGICKVGILRGVSEKYYIFDDALVPVSQSITLVKK